jgi:hypothetical protein
MARTKKKELSVPTLTERQIALVLAGLRSEDPEDRALAIAETLQALMPNTPPAKFKHSISDAKTWQDANSFIYEVIGGPFRHALWADQNPGDFYSQMGKTFQATQNINVAAGNFIIEHSMPEPSSDADIAVEVDLEDDLE